MQIKKVTILGANGTMGRNIAAIFASFGDAEVYLVSRTMEKIDSGKRKGLYFRESGKCKREDDTQRLFQFKRMCGEI